jgi:hypothetical protein
MSRAIARRPQVAPVAPSPARLPADPTEQLVNPVVQGAEPASESTGSGGPEATVFSVPESSDPQSELKP